MNNQKLLDLKYKAFDALGRYIAAATNMDESDIDFSALDEEVIDTIEMLGGKAPEENE